MASEESLVRPSLTELMPDTQSTVGTASTDSMTTVKGSMVTEGPEDHDISSSFSFPSTSADTDSPVPTPGLHKPFTVLSPTNTPAGMPKSSTYGRKAIPSGHPWASTQGMIEPNSFRGPTSSDIILRVQQEPGLVAFWNNLTQILRESFGAERASMIVPRDSTDVENVPWTQIATYTVVEEDTVSRDPYESRFNDSGVSEALYESSQTRTTSSNLRDTTFSGNTPAVTSSRPKLESRHSYAGFSSGRSASPPAGLPKQPSFRRTGSNISLFTSRASRLVEETLANKAELNAETLQLLHDAREDRPRGNLLSQDTFNSIRPNRGTILNPPQPLDAEADPLIVSASVMRVIETNRIVTLTREYYEESEVAAQRAKARKERPSHAIWPSPKKQTIGLSAIPVEVNRSAEESRGSLTPDQSDQSTGESTSPTSSVTRGSSEQGSVGDSADWLYEDYEQNPAAAWRQSPAPSPAMLSNPEENPFFTQGWLDGDAFAENPPAHDYAADGSIPAIGTERAHSIIHVPLIHPTLSHSRRPQSLVDDRQSKRRFRNAKSDRAKDRSSEESQDSAQEAPKRIPIAILTFLSSTIPFPAELVETLALVSSLLATSLYNARQHTKLLNESNNRRVAGRAFGDEVLSPSHTSTVGLSFINTISKDRESASRTASMSERSFGSNYSPQPSVRGSIPPTPNENILDNTRGAPDRVASSSVSVTQSGNYFAPSTREEAGSESKRRPSLLQGPRHRNHQSKSNVKESMAPPAKVPPPPTEIRSDLAHTLDHSGNFKPLSAPTLMNMIANGATQQFIAKADAGDIVWTNEKFLTYRQASAAEVIAHPWKHVYKDDVKVFKKQWANARISGEHFSHILRLTRFDGQARYFHMRILPLPEANGTPRFWHGQAMDIHDQRQGELDATRAKEKAVSEAKYRALANSNPVIIFAASTESGMTFANTQWLSYSGQTLEEAQGFGFLDFVHPKDLIKCRFPGVDARSGTIKAQEIVLPEPSTKHAPSSISGASGKSGDTITDHAILHPRKSSESLASLSEIAGAPSGLLSALIKEGIFKCARDAQGNISVNTEMRLKSRSGEYRWHIVQGSYLESVNFGRGDAQWYIACSDITDQKDIESKLQAANTALEKEMTRKMEYLSSMSHEIRTPLNGIVGNLQFLNNSGLDPQQQEWSFGVEYAARGMQTLINDILDVSKAEAKMLKLSLDWFGPRANIEQALETLFSRAVEKNLELSYEIDERIPWRLWGDGQRLRQILLNLVGNAIKFTKRGEIWLDCHIVDDPKQISYDQDNPLASLGSTDILVQWAIHDTGMGFTNEQSHLLFKPYSQIETSEIHNAGGTGLGLILCKTMVELHGGKIYASSVPGEGSVFKFHARFKTERPPGSLTPSVSSYDAPLTAQQSGSQSPAALHQRPSLTHLPSSNLSLRGTLFRDHMTESPGRIPRLLPTVSQDSPSQLSDGSSIRSADSVSSILSQRSMRSSATTFDTAAKHVSMKLELPARDHGSTPLQESDVTTPQPTNVAIPSGAIPDAANLSQDGGALASLKHPKMLSIMVVCPLYNTRRTTYEHVRKVMPAGLPAQINTEEDVQAALEIISGDEPMTFTHIILQLPTGHDVVQFMEKILGSKAHPKTCIVAITDHNQQMAVMRESARFDYKQLEANKRLIFLPKPVKPIKFSEIFDPGNENVQWLEDPLKTLQREQLRLQREAYALFKEKLGGRGLRVLAVEDNHLQMTLLHNFLCKICDMEVTKAWDGAECCENVFSRPPSYYSVIITDIEMPIMGGYEACRRIRAWEEQYGHPPVPIISLSANVMRQGWRESAANGFTEYAMKPVQFIDLGHLIMNVLRPDAPHIFLRDRPVPAEVLDQEAED